MTIQEHVEILRRGPRTWNAWRAENPSIVPDLGGIALSIGDRQLGPMNGGPINLSRTQLTDAALYFATLTGADMRGCDLTNADLRGARLEGVDLTGADLAGAQLDGASMVGSVLKAANLSGASLSDVRGLTPDQIGEAEGDLGTVLPYDLERPAIWTVGQGVLHIQTARDVAEDAARETAAEPAPMAFRDEPEPAPEPYFARQPMHTPAVPEEPDVAMTRVEAHVEAERDSYRSPTETRSVYEPEPEPTAPQDRPYTVEPPAQTVSMHANGREREARDGADGQNEDKHVSWLVGGPRRVGRRDRSGPHNSWRDRA